VDIIPTAGLAFNVAIGRAEDSFGNSESETNPNTSRNFREVL